MSRDSYVFPRPVSQCLEIVVVQLDVESIVRHGTVEEREDLVHDLPARERWAFVFCAGSLPIHRSSF